MHSVYRTMVSEFPYMIPSSERNLYRLFSLLLKNKCGGMEVAVERKSSFCGPMMTYCPEHCLRRQVIKPVLCINQEYLRNLGSGEDATSSILGESQC